MLSASEQQQIDRTVAALRRIWEQRRCERCDHRADYHHEGECGQDVCPTDSYCKRCGNYCDDPMHEGGYCRCPSFVDPDPPIEERSS